MTDTPPRLPPDLSTPQNREKFFRHLLQNEKQPLESRIQVLAALFTLVERAAHHAGLRTGELQNQGPRVEARDESVLYRAARVAWDELQRKGFVPAGTRGATTLREDEQLMAMFGGIAVRNALEEIHAHLPDRVMKQLNMIVRNAIFTTLHAARTMTRSKTARAWMDYQLERIPPYWEQPELLEEYADSLKRHGEEVDVTSAGYPPK